MDLYEVMAPGCHTPLTSQEIEGLFQASQLSRDEPCRKLGEAKWRTLDEIFPLLKYAPAGYACEPYGGQLRRKWKPFAVAAGLVAILLAWGGYYVWNQVPRLSRDVVLPPKPAFRAAVLPVVARFASVPPRLALPYRTAPSPYKSANLARLETEKRQRETRGAIRASQVDRMRQDEAERAQATRKADGTDYHVPLDVYYDLRDPLMVARVRVRDNDVTSFDIWIERSYYREVQKQKGITQSRTDETFIYNNGRASLYYVWEIAGEINHCMLRVRQN